MMVNSQQVIIHLLAIDIIAWEIGDIIAWE
jgi:hypothetical protein